MSTTEDTDIDMLTDSINQIENIANQLKNRFQVPQKKSKLKYDWKHFLLLVVHIYNKIKFNDKAGMKILISNLQDELDEIVKKYFQKD